LLPTLVICIPTNFLLVRFALKSPKFIAWSNSIGRFFAYRNILRIFGRRKS
jgi:hypothetical protein